MLKNKTKITKNKIKRIMLYLERTIRNSRIHNSGITAITITIIIIGLTNQLSNNLLNNKNNYLTIIYNIYKYNYAKYRQK